jgi:hypothetical protein
MSKLKRIKPRPYRGKITNKLRQLLSVTPRRRCVIHNGIKQPKMVAQYARVKPHPRGYDRWNHAVIRRLQAKRFLTPTGHVKASLRQILASHGIEQASLLERKWSDYEERLQQVQLPEAERVVFRKAFSTWYKAGCPETRENYFWRIKYCGLIELGVEGRYLKPLLDAQRARRARGLK